MSEPSLTTHAEGGILTLTVNRPDKLNALNAEVIGALQSAVDAAANDPDVRAVIITGAGGKAFVAGADIGELRELEPEAARRFVERGQAVMNRIERLGKPVIAAINGFALGGGCELALACTIRIASESARFGLPEVKLGLIPGYGGTQRLLRLVGRGRALHLMLTGEQVTATEAQDIGLVTMVVAQDDLAEEARRLAGALAAGAPLAQRGIMDAVHDGADLSLEAGLAREIEAFVTICASDDMREGTAAFLEKRRPNFQGR